HVSADYFAVFGDRLQQLMNADRLAPGFVAIMSNGTSGDVNNINFRGPAEKLPSYQKMYKVADDIAQQVHKKLQQVTYQRNPTLVAPYNKLTPSVRKPAADMLYLAKHVVKNPGKVELYHPLGRYYPHHTIQKQEQWPEKLDIVL